MILTLLQAAPGGSSSTSMIFLLAIVVVFYFFMIRPQMRKQKKENEFRTQLQKGAKIVTIGGLHGRILEVSDRTFLVEIDSNVKVRIEKSAISADATRSLDQNSSKALAEQKSEKA
jgi:preprotein translocase subunit YajC